MLNVFLRKSLQKIIIILHSVFQPKQLVFYKKKQLVLLLEQIVPGI